MSTKIEAVNSPQLYIAYSLSIRPSETESFMLCNALQCCWGIFFLVGKALVGDNVDWLGVAHLVGLLELRSLGLVEDLGTIGETPLFVLSSVYDCTHVSEIIRVAKTGMTAYSQGS